MIDSYGLFPGQAATFQMTGLNIGMKYDFTFFASSQAYGDVNVAYTINGVTTILNTSLNVNGTQTIYNVTPDNYGNVSITVSAATSTSQFGLLGALIIGAHTPSASTVIPTLPVTQSLQSTGTTSAIAIDNKAITSDVAINAYPNPFHDYFNLAVQTPTTARMQVAVYDINGKLVYNNNLGNVLAGMNTFRIVPGINLSAGIYTVLLINADTKSTKTIRLMKQ